MKYQFVFFLSFLLIVFISIDFFSHDFKKSNVEIEVWKVIMKSCGIVYVFCMLIVCVSALKEWVSLWVFVC